MGATFYEEGKPFTVKYHLLSSMLLNELQRLDQARKSDRQELEELQARVAAIEGNAVHSATRPENP